MFTFVNQLDASRNLFADQKHLEATMRYKNWFIMLIAGVSTTAMSACSIAKNYSDSEQEIVNTMTPSKYQPATRQMRSSIETQDILAQAAFWSREYQLNPADLEAAVKLASAVRKMGNAAKAAEITQTTRAMYPDDPYLIAEYAAALIALEKGQDAMKPLDKAIHAAPGYSRLWSLKGAALDQVGNYDLARQHYNRALQITPNDPNIMANMGLSFALAGDPRTAEQWLRRASAHPDAGNSIRQNLDLVLQLQGKPAQYAHMQKSSAPSPTSSPVTSSPRSPSPSYAPTAQRQVPQTAPRPSHSPAMNQTYSRPYNAPLGQSSHMGQPSHLGHRSSMTVVGQQANGPRTAAEMARAAAAKSSQSRITVPHQPNVQPQGNILDRISQSVNSRQASSQGYPPQGHPMPQQQAPQQNTGQQPMMGYPPQQQQQQQQQGYSPYEMVPQRRRAQRRR